MAQVEQQQSGQDGEAVQGARSTREDWLRLAIEALVSEGIDRVKVQIIAKKLSVSRSSFYWFFKNTNDLHGQMLDYWLSKNTAPIIERAIRPADTLAKAILGVFECWVDDRLFDPQLDIAVRLWARRSMTVRAVVAQADEQRVAALSRMFMRHGYDAEDGLIHARVLYFTQIGHYTLDVPENMITRMAHAQAYVRAFGGSDATAEEFAAFRAYVRKLHPDVP